MTIAAFVLGVVATVLAALSLTWQMIAVRLRGDRPKLTAVIGLYTPDGLVATDASSDVRESLLNAAGQLPPGHLIVGVKVVNTGRASFHVGGWAIRADPGGASLVPVADAIGGTAVPHDIPPGGSAVFSTTLHQAQRFADVAEGVDGQPRRIVLTVSSGARTYATKPLAPALFSLGSGIRA
ncbi:hypothetical protein [Mycobacterium decipiens]|uniref:Uncharacterized protein n=1 Tax=Mycobacterium decipiens TaxID=1430326 RepID=A0A1X2LV79_9MYCO|nr:hypothetical protein [Mycobacterium decipiens]OSC40961.1 hypothetical protein B8W66_10915 [Mycobacterium decipiens]